MESKKDTTKMLLGESLQALMLKYPFEKITIKMITDKAGVIRPTFYNYFQDKYELLEWIFTTNVIDKLKSTLDAGMEKESLRLFFLLIDKDKAFYKKAIGISGQNSFEEIMTRHIYDIFLAQISPHLMKKISDIKLLTPNTLSLFYAKGIVDVIKTWLTFGNDGITADDVADAYFFMLSHSILDLIHASAYHEH